MPLITIKTSLKTDISSKEFLRKVSSLLSQMTGKPESYVMTMIETNVPMSFAGSSDPCAYVEVKSIGSLSPKEMSEAICTILEAELNIAASRTYINFQDVIARDWGFNGRTFG